MTSKEWKEHKIGTICEVLSSKRIFAADYVETGIPFYRSKEIIQKSLGENIEEKLYISKEKFLDIKTKFGAPQKLDLLLSAVGERSGIPYLVNDDEEFYFKDGNLIWFRNFNSSLINSNYLYYWLKSYTGQNSLQNLMIGSAQKALTIIGIKGLSIKLPPLETQEKIARVLSSLDDKIELNNKINQNLEQQAQAIFNTYIAKYSSTKYKVKDVILTANTGADAIQKAPIVDYDTGIRCVRVGDLSNNRNFWQWGFTKVTNDVFEQYQLKRDDIIVTRTATLGLNRLITENLNAVYNNGLIRITVDNNKIFPLLLYQHFQTKDFFNYISRIESETSVRPNMKINYLLDYEFSYLKLTEQNELVKILTPLLQTVEINNVENEKLTQLRDTLLPKLMSGEIDVDKVEV